MGAKKYKVFIDGSYGTTGLELRHHLGREAELFEIITVDKEARRSLKERTAAFKKADLIVLCLPDEAARSAITQITPLDLSAKILDTSSAHRTSDQWVYGFPEISGQALKIMNSPRISNPGCYAIGFIALIRPLRETGLISEMISLSAHGVSGYSGGGKTLIETFETSQAFIKTHPYALYSWDLDHKHCKEMQRYSLLAKKPLFQPAVIATYRGMIVSIPLHHSVLAKENTTAAEVIATLKKYYAAAPPCSISERATIHSKQNTPTQTHAEHLPEHLPELEAPLSHPIATAEIATPSVNVFTIEELRSNLRTKLHDKSPGVSAFLPFNLTNKSEALNIITATNKAGDLMLHAQLDNLGKGAALNALANLKLMASSFSK
ncbi:N-acetyl-gamma-glutamyl-phosphate reductase [Spirochaetota bacterium]|nr:N-acetyl-gamma-glutamyl-phosphate reductase [Spirochaetota bacterium]